MSTSLSNSVPAPGPAFGEVLRQWRSCRRVSQLELSFEAEVSARHISCLETGKARPSREMALRLAAALEVPPRGQNALLLAAGFAPVHEERPLEHPALEPAAEGIDFLLEAHEPFPAFVLDRRWNIVRSNRSHRRMFEWILEGQPVPEPVNVLRLCFDPALLRPRIADWRTVAALLLRRLDAQMVGPQPDDALTDLRREILACPGADGIEEASLFGRGPDLLVPFVLEAHGRRLSWLTTLATFGAALDLTLREVVIELLYPTDEATKVFAREMAAPSEP